MKDFIKDSGPAFPCEWDYINSNRAAANGMFLRDYFAAKAMQGMLTDLPKACYGTDWKANVAYEAYALADAMLAARSK